MVPMTALVVVLFAVNLVVFAAAMPKFHAPRGWPRRLRALSAAGLLIAAVDVVALAAAPGTSLSRQALAAALLASSHWLFRESLRVALQHGFALAFADVQPASVVTAGPYRWLGHPLYVAYALTWWAAAVATSAPGPAIGAAVMTLFYVTAAVGEERALAPLRRGPSGLSTTAKGAR